jgi:hypothetical protein
VAVTTSVFQFHDEFADTRAATTERYRAWRIDAENGTRFTVTHTVPYKTPHFLSFIVHEDLRRPQHTAIVLHHADHVLRDMLSRQHRRLRFVADPRSAETYVLARCH